MLAYRWTGHPVTFLNWDNIDQHYALANPTHVDRGVVWIANQLIHSFVFIPAFEDSGILEKILFNSDRTRLDYLFSISIDSIISLFEEVASNDPDSMALTFDVSKRDYKVFVGPAIERE